MNTEKQKLEAAQSVVANSILHGWTIDAKIKYIQSWLPAHYNVKESKTKGSVHCVSKIGINDDEIWSYFLSALKQRFGRLFQEVFHNTCTNHVDFTVHFKAD